MNRQANELAAAQMLSGHGSNDGTLADPDRALSGEPCRALG